MTDVQGSSLDSAEAETCTTCHEHLNTPGCIPGETSGTAGHTVGEGCAPADAETRAEVASDAVMLAAILDGADPTPPEPSCVATVGQFWHQLLTSTRESREERLTALLASAGVGAQCVMADHETLLTELRDVTQALALERTTRAAAVRTLRDALSIAGSVIDNLLAERRHDVDADSPVEIEIRRVRAMIGDLLNPPRQDGATQ